jgi:predicted nucleic acid-binding protein
MPITKLLFIDTNIWLDFYRSKNDATLGLLRHAEAISEKIIVTYQLEGEFKRNRQAVILEGLKKLESPQIQRLGIFSNAQAAKAITKNLKEVEKRVDKLKAQLRRTLDKPTNYDPVYKACQRIFHRKRSPIVLTHSNKLRNSIRRLAFRRFLHGCPPRKRNDINIGDAFNWEWMIHCAKENDAELVIVSRDSDYGIAYGENTYVNDDLRQEFSERVSRKRKLLLYQKLSDALTHFEIPVTEQEQKAESEIVTAEKRLRAWADYLAERQIPMSDILKGLPLGFLSSERVKE